MRLPKAIVKVHSQIELEIILKQYKYNYQDFMALNREAQNLGISYEQLLELELNQCRLDKLNVKHRNRHSDSAT